LKNANSIWNVILFLFFTWKFASFSSNNFEKNHFFNLLILNWILPKNFQPSQFNSKMQKRSNFIKISTKKIKIGKAFKKIGKIKLKVKDSISEIKIEFSMSNKIKFPPMIFKNCGNSCSNFNDFFYYSPNNF
jgi:hypothetical protein